MNPIGSWLEKAICNYFFFLRFSLHVGNGNGRIDTMRKKLRKENKSSDKTSDDVDHKKRIFIMTI